MDCKIGIDFRSKRGHFLLLRGRFHVEGGRFLPLRGSFHFIFSIQESVPTSKFAFPSTNFNFLLGLGVRGTPLNFYKF